MKDKFFSSSFRVPRSSFRHACYDVGQIFRLRRGTTVSVLGVKVYGADWCPDTRRTLDALDKLGVTYDYVNVERDEAASLWVKEHNDGKEVKPTLDVAGQILSAPTERELTSALRERGLMA
jgi:mycoredoxin